MKAASGDLSPTLLLVEMPAFQQGVYDYAIVAQLPWRSPSASQSDLRPTPQKRVHVWYWKPGQKPAAEEVIAITMAFLDGCNGQPTVSAVG